MLVADFKRFPPERPSILELVKKLNIISQMLTHKQIQRGHLSSAMLPSLFLLLRWLKQALLGFQLF